MENEQMPVEKKERKKEREKEETGNRDKRRERQSGMQWRHDS